MKKFTLALSAMLMVAASASAIESGVTYAVVPADASAQAQGLLLTVNAEGALAYTNELSAATNWIYEVGEFDENYNMPYYLTNGGKYLQLTETGVSLTDEKVMTFVSYSWEFEGASTISNYTNFWYPAMDITPCYLNAVNLATEPEQSVATAFFFIEVNENSTLTDIQNELWKLAHPEAMVIAVGGATARDHGKYMAVTDEGRLITTNTLSNNAVWERGWNDEAGAYLLSNLGVKGYLYQGNQSRNITLSETPVDLEIVDSEVLIGAFGITSTIDATPNQYVFLNALNQKGANEDGGIGIWSLDEGSSFFFLSYDPAVTAEEIDAQVTNLYALGLTKADGLKTLKKYMNTSWAGREYGLGELYDVEGAETQEEYEAAYAAAMQAAVSYAEMSMTEGFILNNVRKAQAVAYDTANVSTPFHCQANITLDCLWTAEVIEDADTIINEITYQTFRLRNNAGVYLGDVETWSKPVKVATDIADAAIFRLVLGSDGFEIIHNIDSAYPFYLNNGGSGELTMYWEENDGGSFYTFDKLPAFSEDQPTAIEAEGEYQISDMTKVYSNIKAVRVCVPVGSTPTDVAGVTLSAVVSDDYGMEESTVIESWNAEAIKAIEPTTEKIGIQHYDFDIWDYVTDSVEAQVYTLVLKEEITEPGNYKVAVAEYAFSVKADDAIVYSPEFTQNLSIIGYTIVPVTPEAGIVENFTSISIDPDGLEGWGTNWSYDGENLTVTFNGEIAKDADGNDLDINGEELTMNYDGMDWETWEGGGWIIPVDFSEAGTYVLTIPQGMLENETGFNAETVVEWTVEKKDGIMEITSMKVNGKAYDLQGRPVANPTRGLYIINGVKTYVK